MGGGIPFIGEGMLLLYMVFDVGQANNYSSIEMPYCGGNLARPERWLPGDGFATSGYRTIALT